MEVNLVQVLRLVHILCGAFWLGSAVSLAFFVYPALLTGDVGSAQRLGRIMMGRKLAVALPLAAVVAMASGLWLYRIDFPSMQMQTLTPRAFDYAMGGFFAILTFIVGVSVNRPSGYRLEALADAIGAATPTTDQAAELARLSRKLLISSRAAAVLILGTGAFMALARFTR